VLLVVVVVVVVVIHHLQLVNIDNISVRFCHIFIGGLGAKNPRENITQ
jgi:hypothetical protein